MFLSIMTIDKVYRTQSIPESLSVYIMKINNENLLVSLCAWCGRTRINGHWVDMREHYVGREDVISPHKHIPTHGICPDCVDEFYPQYAAAAKTGISN